MKSKFGKTDPRAELDQAGEVFDQERAQELLLQQSQGGKKRRPLIAKEKKAFDSADYFMKGDDNEASKGLDVQEVIEEQEQIVNPHKSKLSSNFSNKIQEQQEDSDDQEDQNDNEKDILEEQEKEREREEQEERERQREREEQEERERQEQEEKDRKEQEEKQMRDEQIKRAQEKEERERNQKLKQKQQLEEEKMKQQQQQEQQNLSNELNQEEIILKQQEAMMLKMKGNTAKKPLVAKQKKAFDSADYFMKDEHKDSEVEGTESDTIQEQSNNNNKAGESKSKYGQKAKEKKSSDSDNNSPKSSDNFVKIVPPQMQANNSSEGQSPRGSALKSRSGSESRETYSKEAKRVSFSLPSDGQELTGSSKSNNKSQPLSASVPQANSASTFSTTTANANITDDTEDIITPATGNNTINNVHSLKGSRFLSLPNNIQQESDSEKVVSGNENEDIENQNENNEVSNSGNGNEELERLYNEQLCQAEARLISGGKKKPLIAKDKRKDFDSADYFLQQELKKRESAASMFEFGDIDDDSHKNKTSNSSKKSGNSVSSRSKSDYKKTLSMPEFQDEEKTNGKRTSKIRESSFNRQDDLSQSGSENNNSNSNDQELDQNYDDDDEDEDDILSNKNINLSGATGGLSTTQNGISHGSSFDEEEDFLPKITHSKIQNSRFQVYKNHHESDDEDEKDKQKEEQERLAKIAQEEQENIEKQKELEAIQNENNRISAAQSEELMQEQSKGLSQADKYDQFALPLPKHKKNLLSKEKKKEFDSADYFMKEK